MKNSFICPMHPDVTSDHASHCSKCGMQLIKQAELKKETPHSTSTSYTPLIVVVGLILLVSASITLRDIWTDLFALEKTIGYFMTGFFLVFSAFKLMDLKGFAEGYSTYDLLAKRWFNYGYSYPFIELGFGLLMILLPLSTGLLVAEFGVMAFSGIGVALKLLRHEKFQCACLGTFLKVPLTKVTLVEDFGMALLAFVMIILR